LLHNHILAKISYKCGCFYFTSVKLMAAQTKNCKNSISHCQISQNSLAIALEISHYSFNFPMNQYIKIQARAGLLNNFVAVISKEGVDVEKKYEISHFAHKLGTSFHTFYLNRAHNCVKFNL
jgi:hypothetical protein